MLSSMLGACLTLYALATTQPVLNVPEAYPTIQAAIDAAQPGQTVRVAPGTYTEALVFKDGITLEGASRDEVIVLAPAESGPVLAVTGCQSGSIRYISFEHTGTPAEDIEASKPAVVDITDSSVEVLGCAARNGTGSGFRVQGKSTCKVIACEATGNLRPGFTASGTGANLTLVGNTANHNRSGIMFHEGAQGVAKINRCEENRQHGIHILQPNTVTTLFGNVCSRNGGSGIVYTANASGIAKGNRAEENGFNGIYVNVGTSPTLRDNVLQHNLLSGICFEYGNKARATRNHLTENAFFSGEEALHLFYSRQYGELEQIAARLRRDKTKNYSGEWQLDNLYDGIASRCKNMNSDHEADFLQRFNEWGGQYPDSVTQCTALAKAYTVLAWRERGGDRSSEVSDQGWVNFRRYLNDAMEVVQKGENCLEKDPHLYVVKGIILRGLGSPTPPTPPLMTAISLLSGANLTMPGPDETAFLQGVAVEPAYSPLYYERTEFLLPRWYGSPRKLLEFANHSLKANPDDEGKALYARIATAVLYREGLESYRANYRFSWPTIREGYEDIRRRHPQGHERLNLYCYVACAYHDRETAARLFNEIGDSWSGYAWNTESNFQQWKKWATGTEDESPQNNPLQVAVKQGDIAEVKRLLAAGVSANTLSTVGSSMLTVAANEKNVDIMEVLLEAGADANLVPPGTPPPLLTAARDLSNDAMLRLLLDHKADPNIADDEGWTPLLDAVYQKNPNKTRLLLEHGADPNALFRDHRPLHYAIEFCRPDMVSLLLENGADPNALGPLSQTPLYMAVKVNNAEICQAFLEKGVDPNTLDPKDGATPLLAAANNGNFDIVELLVAKGADLRQRASNGATALHRAAARGSGELVDYFLEKTPESLNACAESGRTPLQEAAKEGNVEAVMALLERENLDINARDKEGNTALGLAEHNKRDGIAGLLKQHGATT